MQNPEKEIFDRESALELLDNDEDLLSILIDTFLNENKFELSVLDKMLSEGKMNEAAGYVHATKGAARQLCMKKLKDSGQALEDYLRGKSKGDLQSLKEKMFSDYEEALKLLSQYN